MTASKRAAQLSLCCLWLLLVDPTSAAAKLPSGLTLTAGVSATVPKISPKAIGVEVDASLPLLSELLEVGAGIRVLFQPRAGVSGLLRGGMVAPFGRWRPSVGLELEITSMTRFDPQQTDVIEGNLQTLEDEKSRSEYFRLGAYAAPARLTFGGFAISPLEISVATPLSSRFGQVLLLSLTLKAGWRF